MSFLRIKKGGLLSTIQDLGRPGYRKYGVNPGGVMDRRSARIANDLAGNEETAALLEMHFPAAEIEFVDDRIFALGGAELGASLDGAAIANWRCHLARPGSILRFEGKVLGERVYLAVNGGFRADEWLGSRSTNLAGGIGGCGGRSLQSGDVLDLLEPTLPTSAVQQHEIASNVLIPHYSRFPTLRVIEGPEHSWLNAAGKTALEEQAFTVSHASDRMGFRLEGDPIGIEQLIQMVSSAVTYGTVQLLPDGQLVILMADHQTAGGYPRIAQIIDHDLPVAAQLGGGSKLCFHFVSISEAEALRQKIESDLLLFRIGCKLRRYGQ
ncbi:MAG: biotin-dependent carboxyltransferase family protein [Pyrinomonadaceae bacterium]|nr:biotin-dependent carboxyltransferase family protein [Pyrinomonadaceae bacterium]